MIQHHNSKARTMDRFDAMRVFTRIVERRSFTKTAEDLGLPRSSVTDAVRGLEARLGVRLLQRTTRQVSPTLDGEAYYQRCVSLIADLEEAEGAFTGAKPSGLIRIDVHGTQARYFLLPALPSFLQRYPGIRLHIVEAHQPLDMIREGFDCILRTGDLGDSSLIQRRLATLERGTFASPGYPRPVRCATKSRRSRRPPDGRPDVAARQRDHPLSLPLRGQGRRVAPAGRADGDGARDQHCVGLPGAGSDPGPALSSRGGAGVRRPGRGSARLSADAPACPHPLFRRPSAFAASARLHRLGGRAISRRVRGLRPTQVGCHRLKASGEVPPTLR